MPRRPSYKGALSPSDVVARMAAARRNARRLAEDAQLLLDQGRWASASSLAVLSIEESGKVGVLRRLSLASEAPDLKAGWDGYGSHRRKLGHPLGLGEVFVPNALLSLTDALTEVIDKRAETVASMDARKQAGFYTDCVPDPSGRPFWVEPTAAITPDHARTVVGCAAILLEHREVTMRGRWCTRRVWDSRMLFFLWFELPDAAQAQRRSPSPHPEDVVQGAELAGI